MFTHSQQLIADRLKALINRQSGNRQPVLMILNKFESVALYTDILERIVADSALHWNGQDWTCDVSPVLPEIAYVLNEYLRTMEREGLIVVESVQSKLKSSQLEKDLALARAEELGMDFNSYVWKLINQDTGGMLTRFARVGGRGFKNPGNPYGRAGKPSESSQ